MSRLNYILRNAYDEIIGYKKTMTTLDNGPYPVSQEFKDKLAWWVGVRRKKNNGIMLTSKGIRIPKAILEQCRIRDEVNIEIRNKKLIITPSDRKPRDGWSESFKEMRSKDDNAHIESEEIDIRSSR